MNLFNNLFILLQIITITIYYVKARFNTHFNKGQKCCIFYT